MDFLMNGQGTGLVANTLMANNFSPHALRPWVGKDGRSYIDVPTTNAAGEVVLMPQLVGNNTATLRKDEWKILDTAIVKAAQPRLQLINDLKSRGLTYGVPNALGKTVLETETVSDIGPATTSMDGLRQGEADRPLFDIQNFPLPISYKDFHFSARQIATSRHSGQSVDTTTAELASRKVAEELEQMALGTAFNYTYGGGTAYGLRNFPQRLTKTITDPTAGGWTPQTFIDELLDMKLQSQLNFHRGPWLLYTGLLWDRFLDNDYSAAKGDNTLRERIGRIQNLSSPLTLDFLNGYDVIMVQASTDVIRVINGMNIVTLQWESQGGMMLNFKVMAIMPTQVRADFNGRTGIIHGTT